jgi:23S rRNA pseudouridine955/2504/2580 synthase
MTDSQIITVNEEDEDIRLDRFIRRHYPHFSQGLLEKAIRKAQVRVDGAKTSSNARLKVNQQVSIINIVLESLTEPQKEITKVKNSDIKNLQEAIIYIDDDLIVINKPAGLAVQGGTKIAISIDALLDHLKFDAKERPKLVHRLDKDTSGVLLLARRASVAAKLAEHFKNKLMEKTYWAIVSGKPLQEEGKIVTTIAKATNEDNFERMTNQPDGKKAITFYRIIDYAHYTVSWLEMMPITGRTHQLRIHAADMGHPIIGDNKYGSRVNPVKGAPNKLHLHARNIKLINFMGKNLEFTAPLPKHMQATFKIVGFKG